MQDLKLYKLPSYMIVNKFYIKYNSFISTLNHYEYGTLDYRQFSIVDIENIDINVSYFGIIENGINYVVVDSKYCYKIIETTMKNNNTTRIKVEFDPINSLQLLNQDNIINLPRKFFATHALTTKVEGIDYPPVCNTYEFEPTENTNVSRLRYETTSFTFQRGYTRGQLPNYDTITRTAERTMRYFIVNKNWLGFKHHSKTWLYQHLYKEDGITTDFYVILIPYIVYDSNANRYWYYMRNTTEGQMDYNRILKFILYADPANMVETGLVNLGDWGEASDKIATFTYLSTFAEDEWNVLNEREDFIPIITLEGTNRETYNINKNYNTPFKLTTHRMGVKYKDKFYDLPHTTNGNYKVSKIISFTNGCTVSLRLEDVYNQTGEYLLDVTAGAVMKLPIFIDGVQRLTMTNAESLKSAKVQVGLGAMYNAMSMAVGAGAGQVLNIGNLPKTQETGLTRDDLLIGNQNTNQVVGSANSTIGLIKQAESIRLMEYNQKFATSQYLLTGNLAVDMEYDLNVTIVDLFFNRQYSFEGIAPIGYEINRYVNLSNLVKTLIKGIPFFDLALSDAFNGIYDIFRKGFLYFNDRSEVEDFIDDNERITFYNV